ncbi:hypothetical protein MTX38_19040 [Rhodococcus sp. ARC_M13]|uniref:hypothetical protein n=1 Tax=Rhodococcus sp. ARC_M13 TaxID=2928855 RepID=UPI001FB3E08F|nr:hypothetical protein [Rhodococcus sp. ARC_M13]MCJ0899173.1 hypothetical protein [Rhodococcus sp. ARC_M13]
MPDQSTAWTGPSMPLLRRAPASAQRTAQLRLENFAALDRDTRIVVGAEPDVSG